MTTQGNNNIERLKIEVVRRLHGLFPEETLPAYRVRDYINALEDWVRAIVAESQISS